MKYFKITFLKKLAFSGLVFIILLILAEVILTWMQIFPNDYFTNTPNVSRTYDENPSKIPGISGSYKIGYDELGSRSISDYSKAKHKILAIGGSTTICSVLSQDKTWTALLDKKLGDDYWVGNFANSGNSSNQHVFQFKYILDKPELKDTETVLILVGVNDCRAYLYYQEKYLNMSELDIKKSAFSHMPNNDLPFVRKQTLFKLALFAKQRIPYYFEPRKPIDYLQNFKNTTVPINTLPDLTNGLNHYEQNLKTIITEAKKKNINLVFMTQPTLWKKDLLEKHKTLLAARAHFSKTPLFTGEALNKIMTVFNKRLLSVCKANNIKVIDMQLPKNDTIFYDDMHFNEEGAEVVAEKIYQFLIN